jgi:hypothetical protein
MKKERREIKRRKKTRGEKSRREEDGRKRRRIIGKLVKTGEEDIGEDKEKT